MFRKILYPTDFSDVAMHALKYLIKLREAGAEEVIIMHVVDERDLEAMIEGCLLRHESVKECEEETKKRIMERARERMEPSAEKLKNAGFEVKIVAKIGNPSKCIAEEAKRDKVSLIVMGTHGHTPLREAFIGSVAENVVHYTTVPVLLVRR